LHCGDVDIDVDVGSTFLGPALDDVAAAAAVAAAGGGGGVFESFAGPVEPGHVDSNQSKKALALVNAFVELDGYEDLSFEYDPF